MLLSVLLLPIGTPAQDNKKPAAPEVIISKAPPETPEQLAERKRALQEMLQRLTTTGRIMQVVAHPDDEDGAMLTLESRVKGNTAMLFTFTRGEGGQNAQGAVFFDELGILRTLELLAADKEYGAEERFSHVADFGFSKSAEESFQKWGGEDVPEGDLVRAIREFQPDVLVARFSGTPKDGHGHHVASALMTIKAFHDAADSKRFPLERRPHRTDACVQTWQPLKLYTGLAEDDATLVPDENQPSPILDGKTPAQVAVDGLRFQKSQGLGNLQRSGPLPKRYSSYKLVATAGNAPKLAREDDFFEGIDTSLPALADRFPLEAALQSEDFRKDLQHTADLIAQARSASEISLEAAVRPLSEALAYFQKHIHANSPAAGPMAMRLYSEQYHLQQALVLAEGLTISSQSSAGPFVQANERFRLDIQVTNLGADTVDPGRYPLALGQLQSADALSEADLHFSVKLDAHSMVRRELTEKVDRAAFVTRPYFRRDSPITDSVYQIQPGLDGFNQQPLSKFPILLWTEFRINGAEVQDRTEVNYGTHPVFVAPGLSVSAAPSAVLRRTGQPRQAEVQIVVKNNSDKASSGSVDLEVPAGWTTEPDRATIAVASGDTASATFSVHWPADAKPMQSTIKGKFTADGRTYTENYHLVSRPDLPDAFPYYAPAQTTISLINADIPERHNVGYIMGAGDTLPDDLRSLGFDVHLLTEADLATGDLLQYDSIMTGVRAYATRADLREHNQRLLDYVKQGGTFVVQYEQDYNAFNQGHYTPFPATMGRDRVSQEEQPVKILDPESQILRYPNRITNADFDNWVQERGLYFMKEWSPDYTPLLSMNDVGEAPLQGGLLVAHYGKGTYIYTGLSFYRELPNGVPGAARLLINLLAAGHNPAEQPTVNARK